MLSLESPDPFFSAQRVTSALVKYALALRSITLHRSPITSGLELAAKLNSPIGEVTTGEDIVKKKNSNYNIIIRYLKSVVMIHNEFMINLCLSNPELRFLCIIMTRNISLAEFM